LFWERTNNAIISQTNLVGAGGQQTPTTVISNVDAISMQGVELSVERTTSWSTACNCSAA